MKLTRNPYPYYCLPALFVSSCGMFPSLPEDLPPELEAVLSDKATFDLEPSDPLGDVEVGTVVDNLQGLDGCWGFYERDDLRPNPPLSEFITVHVFDNANGTYTRWQLFTTSGLFGMLNGFRGTFVIVGDNRVRLTLDEGYRTQDDDGNPLDEPSFVERQTPLNQEWELTLSGEFLKIHWRPDADDPQPGDIRTYASFDCPANPSELVSDPE